MTMKPIAELESRPQVNLLGPNGNAFALMGMARQWCRALGRDFEPICEEMMAGDYENLLNVLEREFGDFVDFYR